MLGRGRISRGGRAAAMTALLAVASLAIASPASAIIGGSETAEPWAAYVTSKHGNCSGALVAPRWVLTAAHCVGEVSGDAYSIHRAKDFSVDVGRTSKKNRGETRSVVGIETRRWRERPSLRGTYDDDVALLHLDRAVNAKPLWLLPSPAAAQPGIDLTLYGYGHTAPGSQIKERKSESGTLRKSEDGVNHLYPDCLVGEDGVVCVRDSAASVGASGDSGGPWVMQVDGAPLLALVFTGYVLDEDQGQSWAYGESTYNDLTSSWASELLGLPEAPVGSIVRDPTTGVAWLIDGAGFRRSIPDGGTYECLVEAGATVENHPRESIDLMAARSSDAICVPPPELDPGLLLASAAADGAPANNYTRPYPDISPNGRLVAFPSFATNLVPGVSGTQVYVKNLITGEIAAVSAPAGTVGNGLSNTPSFVSNDLLLFASAATNLDPADTTSDRDAYLADLTTGEVELVERAPDGTAPTTTSFAAVSPDGSAAVIANRSGTLGPYDQLWHKDLSTGELTRIDSAPVGAVPRVWTATGKVALVDTSASKAFLIDPLRDEVAAFPFAADIAPGYAPETDELVFASQDPAFVESPDQIATVIVKADVTATPEVALIDGRSHGPISDDGRYLFFTSMRTAGAGSTAWQIEDLRRLDRITGNSEVVSLDNDGQPIDSASTFGAPSANGSVVALWLHPVPGLSDLDPRQTYVRVID